MVSIRYFCGVGELRKTKSIPCGSWTSSKEGLEAPAAVITAQTHAIPDSRFDIANILRTRGHRFGTFFLCVPEALCSGDSEQELQCGLNQTRIGPWRGAGHHTEGRIVRGTAGCIGRSKLGTVEQIEELHPKLAARSRFPAKRDFLEHSEVEIVDPIGTQRRIDARLAAESEVGRSSETRGIKPPIQSGYRGARNGFVASGQYIRT